MTKYYLIYWTMYQSNTYTRIEAYEVFTTKAKRNAYIKEMDKTANYHITEMNASDFNDLMNEWSKKKDLDFIKYYPVQFH